MCNGSSLNVFWVDCTYWVNGIAGRMVLLKKIKTPLLLLLTTTMLCGCSSSLVLGKVYDGFGSNTAKRFKSYASFSEAQVKQIDSLASSYHSWHRTTQLDRYSEFLSSIVADVESAETLSFAQAEGWWKSVRTFSDDLRVCNPFNVASELLAGLTDGQVDQVAAKMSKELNEKEDEYRAESPEERLQRRVSKITKWGRRSGITFNSSQTELLRATLANQISLGSQRYELRRIWMEEFIFHLEQRDKSGFKEKIADHIATVWRITETAFPDQWHANEKLWTAFIKDFINLQTGDQRQEMITKMQSVVTTLEKLSKKQVSVAARCHQ